MARSLVSPPPSSTVARLLDAGAAARAIGLTPATTSDVPDAGALPVPQRTQTPARAAPMVIKRELALSLTSNETFEQLIELCRRATGARLSASQLARAMLTGVAHCLPYLQHEAQRIGRLRLPSNARGREQERKQFESRIARAFVAGIRAAAAFEPD